MIPLHQADSQVYHVLPLCTLCARGVIYTCSWRTCCALVEFVMTALVHANNKAISGILLTIDAPGNVILTNICRLWTQIFFSVWLQKIAPS